ncbi:hypothetical protein NKI17_35620 [Mesorhizobium sp. M0816]
MGPSSVFYLGTQTPEMYEDFVKGLVNEIKGGFVADAEFDIDESLIATYAREVYQTIGSKGQSPLLSLRNSGVIGIRKALELASATREVDPS